MTIIGDSPNGENTNTREMRLIELTRLPVLMIHLDEESVSFRATDLRDNGSNGRLMERIGRASSCALDLEALTAFADADRQLTMRFIAEVKDKNPSIQITVGHGRFGDDLFAAMMHLLQNAADAGISRCADGAIEAAALTCESDINLRLSCSQVVDELRERGVRDIRASTLVKQALAFRDQRIGVETQSSVTSILSIWADAPCGADVLIPSGWRLNDQQITSADQRDCFPARVLITGIFEDIEEGTFSVELAWGIGNRWISHRCPRGQIASRHSIVELSNRGLPVNSNNADILVDYLADFERENRYVIPRSGVARRLGWFRGDGEAQFLCGHNLIVASEQAGCNQFSDLAFHGEDEGDEQIVDSIRKAGTMQSWLNAVTPLQNYPRAMFGVYASLCAPTLRLTGGPNFAVSYDGRTSVGKTTTQIVAASCWGYPNLEGNDPSIIFGWNASRVFVERTSAILNGIPLILDDTKVVQNKSDIPPTIYQFVNGGGRGRGSQRGLARTRSWKSVMISSGEEPLTSFTQEGGTRARVLGLWGSPFDISEEAARITVNLRGRLEDHHGHAGPAFVDYLTQNQGLWQSWRDWYRQSRCRFQELAESNPVASRMAACFASLELTAHLAHCAIPFPWQYTDTIRALWDEITADTDEADQGAAALRYIVAWCHSKCECFHDVGTRDRLPTGGWLGKWRVELRASSEDCLAIYPHKLDEALDERGYSPTAIRRLWIDSGWVMTETRKTTIRLRIESTRSPMVAIRWSAINELMLEDDESEPRARPAMGTRGAMEGPVISSYIQRTLDP